MIGLPVKRHRQPIVIVFKWYFKSLLCKAFHFGLKVKLSLYKAFFWNKETYSIYSKILTTTSTRILE